MNFYLSEFFDGFQTQLSNKKAESDLFTNPNGSSIFPTIESQTTWKFSRSPGKLKLNDGSKVHVFDLLDGEHDDQCFPLLKKPDDGFHEFEKDNDFLGAAQIHRSNPGSVYLTLHDGKKNPTYTFRHVYEDNWKAIPKKKNNTESPVTIDKEAFESGLTKAALDISAPVDSYQPGLLDDAWNGLHKGLHGLKGLAMQPGFSPSGAALAGLGAGAAYDIGKRTLYNTKEENEQETGLQRLARYGLPAAALGGLGLAEKNYTNYHKFYPIFK